MQIPHSKSGWWHGVVLGAATFALVAAIWTTLSAPPPAYGQFADAAAQRVEMIKELRTANAKLNEIAGLLREMRDDARKDKDAQKPEKPSKHEP